MTDSRRALPKGAALLLAAFVAAAGPAAGADKPAAKAAADRPAGKAVAARPEKSALLTPAQLRDCVAQEKQLQAQTDGALKEKAVLDAEKAALQRSGSVLTGERAAIDPTDVAALDAHNDKALAHDKLIDAFEAKAAAFNVKAEAAQSARDAYVKACDKRRYDDRDLNDLQRKK